MKDTIICDLDDTIALTGHRKHMVEGVENPDWSAFFAACEDDTPNDPVIDCLAVLCDAYRIVIFSGRSDEVELETREWLGRHAVIYDRLYMRQQGDYRPDEELKREMLDTFVDRDRVAFVLDDRDSVVKMWREEGFSCFQVAPGNF